VCVLDDAGAIVRQVTIAAHPTEFLHAIASFRDDLVVGVECSQLNRLTSLTTTARMPRETNSVFLRISHGLTSDEFRWKK
jgi:hypothetical protein